MKKKKYDPLQDPNVGVLAFLELLILFLVIWK